MNVQTETSWIDQVVEMFSGFAMAGPADDLQCLAWGSSPDAADDAEGTARRAWQVRLDGPATMQ